MKRSTADFILDLAPVILRAMDLVELLYRGFRGMGESKRFLVTDRVMGDPDAANGLDKSDVHDAIDRAVLWNNAAGWTHLDAFDTKFEQREPRA